MPTDLEQARTLPVAAIGTVLALATCTKPVATLASTATSLGSGPEGHARDGDLMTASGIGHRLSIQERLYPSLPCFGCGPSNTKGLQLRSYPGDGVVTAAFMPWPEHDNGLGYLNGGIISTVLDCHSAAAVMVEAERHGWPPLPGAALPYVTAGLDVRYLRPCPLHDRTELRAVVTAVDEAQMTAEAELVWDGKIRATATAHWKRWRPR